MNDVYNASGNAGQPIIVPISNKAGAVVTKLCRKRGNGVSYQPDIEVRDFDWSTTNFLKKIEADLEK